MVSLFIVSSAICSQSAAQNSIDFDRACKLVLEQYPKIASARTEVESSIAKIREKKGAFDPIVSAQSEWLRFNSDGKAASSQVFGATIEATLDSGLSIATGTRFGFGKVKSPATTTGDGGETFVQLKIPLLRNWLVNEKSVQFRQAQIGLDLAQQTLRTVELDSLRAMSGAYWDWVAAQEKLRLAQSLLQLGAERAKAISERVTAGDLPAVDQIEAETEVKRREAALLKSRRDLEKAAIKLDVYLGGQASAVIPAEASRLKDEMDFPDLSASDLQRPELDAVDTLTRLLQQGLAQAKNETKPNFDVVVGSGIDAGARSIGQTSKVGVIYSIPIGQNVARGRVSDLEQKLAKLTAERELLKRQIESEILDAQSAIKAAKERASVSLGEVSLSKELENAEKVRFEIGEGTLFLINQRERSTFEAEQRLVDILAELAAARQSLKFAQGRVQ